MATSVQHSSAYVGCARQSEHPRRSPIHRFSPTGTSRRRSLHARLPGGGEYGHGIWLVSRALVLGLLEGKTAEPAATSDAHTELLKLLSDSESDWIRVCTLFAVAENGLTEGLELAVQRLQSSNPVIRETALYAVSKLATATKVVQAASGLIEDSHPAVRSLASSLVGSSDDEG